MNIKNLSDIIYVVDVIVYSLGNPLSKKNKSDLRDYALELKNKIIELNNKKQNEK